MPVERNERAERALLDGLDHALQRLVGFFAPRRTAITPGRLATNTTAQSGPNWRTPTHRRGKGIQLGGFSTAISDVSAALFPA